jgi:hypothetical protein
MKSITQKYLITLVIILLVIITGVYFYLSNKKEPTPEPVKETTTTPTRKPIDTSTWTTYTNNKLGFSMLIPPDGPTLYRCQERPITRTPIKVFEDNLNGIAYISQAYYYAADWNSEEQKYTGSCDKVVFTLSSLKKYDEGSYSTGLASHPFLGWKIIIDNPKNDNAVADLIKQNFGSTCIIDSDTLLPSGEHEFAVRGTDWSSDGFGNCYIDFAYKILYYPQKHKLMSVILGQECTFNNIDPSYLSKDEMSSYQCYDDTMIQSFKFQ